MATAAEKLAYRKFKAALDATYDEALRQLRAEGVASVNWIKDDKIREAYYEVWSELSYKEYVKTFGPYDRALWNAAVANYARTHLATRISEVWAYSKTLYVDTVNSITETAMNQGYGVEKTARIIEKDVNSKLKGNINRWRARRIAQTELVGAGNYGAWVAMMDAVSEGARIRKQWMTNASASETQRHSEVEGLNLQVRDVDQWFDVDGEQAMYPGDPTLSAGNVINCKCVIRAVSLDYQPEPEPELEVEAGAFVPAKSRAEVEQRIRDMGVAVVNLKGFSLERANYILKAVEVENRAKGGIKDLYFLQSGQPIKGALGTYNKPFKRLTLSPTHLKVIRKKSISDWPYTDQLEWWKDPDNTGSYSKGTLEVVIKDLEAKIATGAVKDRPFTVAWDLIDQPGKEIQNVVHHEFGHFRHLTQWPEIDDEMDVLYGMVPSDYAKTNRREYFAEWYAYFREYGITDEIPIALREIFKRIK